MASLAGMLREKGHPVCGSDSDVYPPMSDFLDRLGIPVFKGYNPANIEKAKPDLVVIGNALSRCGHSWEDNNDRHVGLGA
jgi:UDP-N-acetylmuramate: L-alanyl-gamma-D-glutamyl-meso-diaminopimelate ligase